MSSSSIPSATDTSEAASVASATTRKTSNVGGGLGQSPPLVTIAARPPPPIATMQRQAANDDHPLAAAATAAAVAPSIPPAAPSTAAATAAVVEATTAKRTTTPGTTSTTTSYSTNAPPTTTTTTKTVISVSTTSTTTNTSSPSSSMKPQSPVAKSLDALADQFLRGPSYRTQELGMPPLLVPPPLPPANSSSTSSSSPLYQKAWALARRRAWGDVLQVVSDLLRREPTSPYAPVYTFLLTNRSLETTLNATIPKSLQTETFQLMMLECHAFMKLRRYTDLGREIDRWTGNFVNMEDHDAELKLDIIPGGMYILAAASQQYTEMSSGGVNADSDMSTQCVDALYKLLTKFSAVAAETTTNDDPNQVMTSKAWMVGVYQALANAFIKQKHWRMALSSFDSLWDLLPALVDWTLVQEKRKDADDRIRRALLLSFHVEILSRQVRIMLQVGCLDESKLLLDDMNVVGQKALGLIQTMSESSSSPALATWLNPHRIQAQLTLHSGLYDFANNYYDTSLTSFQTTMELLRKSQQALASSKSGIEEEEEEYPLELELFTCPLWMEPLTERMTMAWNNMAMCSLYACQMKEAIKRMEALVRENPTLYLTDRLAFNLATLYELAGDTTTSSRKKRVLQLVAKRFFLHDIGPESFRVN